MLFMCYILTCNSDFNNVAQSWIKQSPIFGDLVEAGVLALLSSPHWSHSEDSRLGIRGWYLTGQRLWDNGCLPCYRSSPQQKEIDWFAVIAGRGLKVGQKGGDWATEGKRVPTLNGTSWGLHRQDWRRERAYRGSRGSIWRSTRKGEENLTSTSILLWPRNFNIFHSQTHSESTRAEQLRFATVANRLTVTLEVKIHCVHTVRRG